MSEPSHFEVQISYPHPERQYRTNKTFDVITTTAQRAIDLACEGIVDPQVHSVQRRNLTRLVVDPVLVESDWRTRARQRAAT